MPFPLAKMNPMSKYTQSAVKYMHNGIYLEEKTFCYIRGFCKFIYFEVNDSKD